jgi:hypothetical protein
MACSTGRRQAAKRRGRRSPQAHDTASRPRDRHGHHGPGSRFELPPPTEPGASDATGGQGLATRDRAARARRLDEEQKLVTKINMRSDRTLRPERRQGAVAGPYRIGSRLSVPARECRAVIGCCPLSGALLPARCSLNGDRHGVGPREAASERPVGAVSAAPGAGVPRAGASRSAGDPRVLAVWWWVSEG